MKFEKYHALGNDYLVLNPDEQGDETIDGKVARICHRHFGLGSDGLLLGPLPTEKADFGLRIFNPGGDEAEKSGNGLRIFARYLYDLGKVGNESFTVHTAGGVVTCRIDENARSITVDMGEVQFAMDHIPVDGPEQTDHNFGQRLQANGKTYIAYVADIGNPHCVIPLPEISGELARREGPELETHKAFPNKTNVQFLQVIDRSNIRIEIWERGAGYTLASGSSGSAAAAVAHRIGQCDREITVHMRGGRIQVTVGDNYEIRMTGPATRVATMELFDEVFAFEIQD